MSRSLQSCLPTSLWHELTALYCFHESRISFGIHVGWQRSYRCTYKMILQWKHAVRQSTTPIQTERYSQPHHLAASFPFPAQAKNIKTPLPNARFVGEPCIRRYKSLIGCVKNVKSLYYHITKQDAWCQENNLSFIWISRNIGHIFDYDERKLNSSDELGNTNFTNINLQNLRPSGRLLNRTDICRAFQNIFVIVVGNGALQTWLLNKVPREQCSLKKSCNFLRMLYLEF